MMIRFKCKKNILVAFLFIVPFALMSCLASGPNQVSSQVQVGFELASFDDTLTAGQDTILFESVRFILGDSFFVGGTDTDSLIINRQPRQIDFELNSSNPLAIVGGGFPEGTYQQLAFSIPKAPESDPLIDNDFVDGNTRFTLIAEGTYNGFPFTYRSERVFQVSFSLNTTVPEFNQAFTFILSNDVRGWFLSGSGLLDPRDADNSKEINDNIEQLFTIDIPE